MLNYPINIKFSKQHSNNRMQKAQAVLGEDIVTRILAFTFYLLGANLQDIAQYFNCKRVTAKTMVGRILEEGLPAFEDRRRSASTFLPSPQAPVKDPVLRLKTNKIVVELDSHHNIEIPRENKLQYQTVLLTLLSNKMLKLDEVAEALSLSTDRTRKLKAALIKEDASALIDKRGGQQYDYCVTPELKAQLIQQFALNVSTGQSTSSERLSADLKERCGVDLKPRTLRIHMAKLGLPKIRDSLPELLTSVKKT